QLAHQDVAAREGTGQAVEEWVSGHERGSASTTMPQGLSGCKRRIPRGGALSARRSVFRAAFPAVAPHEDRRIPQREARGALAPDVAGVRAERIQDLRGPRVQGFRIDYGAPL